MSTTLDSALVADVAGEVSGSVLGPQDAGYDAARAVHNGLIDRKPALIVRCRTTNDVVAALGLARRATPGSGAGVGAGLLTQPRRGHWPGGSVRGVGTGLGCGRRDRTR